MPDIVNNQTTKTDIFSFKSHDLLIILSVYFWIKLKGRDEKVIFIIILLWFF